MAEEAETLIEAIVNWLQDIGISDGVKIRPRGHVRDDADHSSSAFTDKYIDIKKLKGIDGPEKNRSQRMTNFYDGFALFTTLLNWADVTVTEIRNSSHERVVTIVVKGHGLGRTLHLRHLSMLGKETYIKITPRRGRCENCDDNPTTTKHLIWYTTKSKMTKPFPLAHSARLFQRLVLDTVGLLRFSPGVVAL